MARRSSRLAQAATQPAATSPTITTPPPPPPPSTADLTKASKASSAKASSAEASSAKTASSSSSSSSSFPAAPAPAAPTDLPILAFADAASFRNHMLRAGSRAAGLWLRIAKKGAGADIRSVTYPDAVDEALCCGWIDGQRRRCAADPARFFLQRFTPRRRPRRSAWSARNVARVAALEAAGRMAEAGRAEVRAARAEGRWGGVGAGV